MFRADPNDNRKQIPYGTPHKAYGRAEIVTSCSIHEAPSYVLINSTGSYAFAYNTTASHGTSLFSGSTQYVSGTVVHNMNQLPVKLDISPNAWKKCNAAHNETKGGITGQITFVYQGGF